MFGSERFEHDLFAFFVILSGSHRSLSFSFGRQRQMGIRDGGTAALVLPPAWRAALQHRPAPEPAWHTDPQQQWVRLTTGEGAVAFRVLTDGSLQPCQQLPAAAQDGAWLPCCVVDTAVPRRPSALAVVACPLYPSDPPDEYRG